jgi:hypothetical protein
MVMVVASLVDEGTSLTGAPEESTGGAGADDVVGSAAVVSAVVSAEVSAGGLSPDGNGIPGPRSMVMVVASLVGGGTSPAGGASSGGAWLAEGFAGAPEVSTGGFSAGGCAPGPTLIVMVVASLVGRGGSAPARGAEVAFSAGGASGAAAAGGAAGRGSIGPGSVVGISPCSLTLRPSSKSSNFSPSNTLPKPGLLLLFAWSS